MDYYFNTYYVNFAISTEYCLYAHFKSSCNEISSKLANQVVCYGERRLNQEQYWQTEYWKHFYEQNYNLISGIEMLQKMQTIDSNDVILTGAGVSKAAGIPTQVELEEELFLHDIEKLYLYCTQSPIYLIKKFRFFYLCLSCANPTKAHYAIKKIWNQTNCIVITENLDLLHEKTGTNVVHAQYASEFLANMIPNRIFLFGVGNPCCQYLLKNLYEKGCTVYATSFSKPNLNVESFEWFKGDINYILN